MIIPHPESDLSVNIMVLGADIVKLLQGREFVLLEDVLVSFVKTGAKRTPDLFFNALTCLYSFGLIDKKGYKIRLMPRVIKQQQELF
jgi:hypothetical protein